jgi:AraC-like DNA-binding protein
MISNLFISPHPFLQPFVYYYLLSTSNDEYTAFNSRWAASNEMSLIFFLKDLPEHVNEWSDSMLNTRRSCVVGSLTRFNGIIHFKGNYYRFIIHFKLNGINKIFHMPMHDLTNKIYPAEDVFGNKVRAFHNQLLNAECLQQMAIYADTFLLSFLNGNNKSGVHDGITVISQDLCCNTDWRSVVYYANSANMSVRSFERKFTEQVGITPKLCIKLARFNKAVQIKLTHPHKTWIAIAYECGYFDQMHFIKDFKQFAGVTPTDFFTKELSRPRMDINKTGKSTFIQLNNQLFNKEEFILVKRTEL